MWQTRQALEAGTDYTQLEDKRWRAEYRGFLSIEAVGTSPRASQFELEKAFDAELAQLVARTRRTATVVAEPPPGTAPVRREARRRSIHRQSAKPVATRGSTGRKR